MAGDSNKKVLNDEEIDKLIAEELKILDTERKAIQTSVKKNKPSLFFEEGSRRIPFEVQDSIFVGNIENILTLDAYVLDCMNPLIRFYCDRNKYLRSSTVENMWREQIASTLHSKGVFKSNEEIDEVVSKIDKTSYIAKHILHREYSGWNEEKHISIDVLNNTVLSLCGELDYKRAFLMEVILKIPGGKYFFQRENGYSLAMIGKDGKSSADSAGLPVQVVEADEAYLKRIFGMVKTYDPRARLEKLHMVNSSLTNLFDMPFDRSIEESSPPFESKIKNEDLPVLLELSRMASEALTNDKPITSSEVYQLFDKFSVFNRYNIFELLTEKYGDSVRTTMRPFKVEKVSYDDIGGYDNNLKFLQNIPTKRELVDEINMILLKGPPGTGKSTSVKAFVNSLPDDAKALFLGHVNIGYKMGFLNRKARAKPDTTIIGVVEDVDLVVGSRERGMDPGALVHFLDLDSAEAVPSNLMYIVTTNKPLEIDPAMLRPGRTQCVLDYSEPSIKELGQIAGIYLNRFNLKDDKYTAKKIAALSDGLVGDDVRSIMFNWKHNLTVDVTTDVGNLIKEAQENKKYREERREPSTSKAGREFV